MYEKLKQPKIIYKSANDNSMRAAYDSSCKFLYAATLFIPIKDPCPPESTEDPCPPEPTEDLSLLAILNSKLFNWYAHQKYKFSNPKDQSNCLFTKKNMVKAPITPRTAEQKAQLSGLVQQILDDPDSL